MTFEGRVYTVALSGATWIAAAALKSCRRHDACQPTNGTQRRGILITLTVCPDLPSPNRPCLKRDAAAKTATLVRLRVMGYYVGRTGTGERYVSRDPGKTSHGALGLSIQDALSGNSSLRHRRSVRRSRARVGAPREALRGHGGRVIPDGHCLDRLVCRAWAWVPRDCALHPERGLLLHASSLPVHGGTF